MNEDVKEYADRANSNKMKKSSNPIENGQDEMKNLEEKLMKSFYQHLSNCNERNDASNSSSIETNTINNLNRSTETANGKPRNGDYNRYKNSSYRNIYGSSSSEDDDEHCVYTYKGAEMANVESFLNVGAVVPNGRDGSLCSSPDMDYLEMDFDPGPSNGQDSDSDNASPHVPDAEDSDHLNENLDASAEEEEADCDENANCYQDKAPATSCSSDESSANLHINELSCNDNEQPCCSKSLDNERRISEDRSSKSNQCYICCDSSDDELPKNGSRITDRDDTTFIADGYREDRRPSEHEPDQDMSFASISDADDIEEHFCCFDSLLPMDPTYSISAIINLLTALHIPHDSISASRKLSDLLQRRRILKNTSLVDYLFSRAVQGANETDFLHFLSASSERKLHSRFFTTYPKRNVNYLEWMSRWIKKGALPVVTRNVQERGTLAVKKIIYNQWRHNVIYKIQSGNVSLTNPLEHIEESVLSRQLCQAPLIYVKHRSLIRRWHSKVDLRPLLKPNDQRWCTENVLGQLATVIREHSNNTKTKHYIRIPSNCQCGITLFAPSEDIKLCNEIDEASELPLAVIS